MNHKWIKSVTDWCECGVIYTETKML
jgi:hypothetical protein